MSEKIEEDIKFSDLGLNKSLLKVLDELGYEVPTPIQREMIPHVLEGRDVLGQAQTGTGKTAAFALPLLTNIDLNKKKPQVLVLAPTRELAIQVSEAFQKYATHLHEFHVVPIYGGQDYSLQLRQLKRGVHVVVGTPGRVMDHMRRKSLVLDSLQCLVLDEADEMLRMGFIDDVTWILEQTPAERQIALFSATMPEEIKRIAQRYQKNPVEVKIQMKTTTADTINQRYWIVKDVNKLDALTRILESESSEGIIIFVRTKTETVELADKLLARGYACKAINGDMAQKQREKTVEDLKSGKLDILIATDVAARGLDVERISHVINYDIPYDTESYIHRIGRTGRAGRSGEAILFVSPREQRMLNVIMKVTGKKMKEMELPSREDINEKKLSRFKDKIIENFESGELEHFAKIIDAVKLEKNYTGSEVAAVLAKMLYDVNPGIFPYIPRKKENKETREGKEMSSESSSSRKSYSAPAPSDDVEEGMERYRVPFGKNHGLKPGLLVGIIAGEAEIDGEDIGKIEINDDWTTIDLPEGMPKEIYKHLKKVKLFGKEMRITKVSEESGPPERSPKREFSEPKRNRPRRDDARKRPERSSATGGGRRRR